MTSPRPELLVNPAWLAARLNDPKVRVFDCSLHRIPQPVGPSLWESCRENWRAEHIPGASYIHMVEDLIDPDAPCPFTLPKPDMVASLLSSRGIPQGATIVLYGSGYIPAIHRVWWTLRASGITDAKILDSSLKKWIADGYPVTGGEEKFVPTRYVCSRRPIVAYQQDVEASISGSEDCLINALSPEIFEGAGNQVFGRRGRIPNSINIPAESLIDSTSGQLKSYEELTLLIPIDKLANCRKIISYCGGGLAASTVFFALSVLGFDNTSLYDGSLFDWSSNPDLPMVIGPV